MHLGDESKGRRRSAGDRAADTPHLDDVRLARRAIDDRDAAQELLERLGPRVRHTVWLLVGRSEEIEDLTHACLLAILENLGKYKGTGPLEAWAGQLTYRVLMRLLKRKRRSDRTLTLVPEEIGVATENPEVETQRKGIADRLSWHMSKLPEKRRQTLVLRLAYGYSVAEVAAITGAPVNTVRDRIRVGLKELRQSIARDPASAELMGRKSGG